MSYQMGDVLDAWDTLTTFTSYERTAKRITWIRRAYDIEGDIEDWLENKFANVIEEYSKLRKVSFDLAKRELRERPVKPWKGDTLKGNPPTMVYLAVQGPKNITTLGAMQPLSQESLDGLARFAASKKPGRRYYVVTATSPKQILYRWHVGEGMSHEEGWWVD